MAPGRVLVNADLWKPNREEKLTCFSSSQRLGSAIVLGPSIFPLLEQLGLLDKVDKISKPVQTIHLVQENLKRIGELDLSDHKER